MSSDSPKRNAEIQKERIRESKLEAEMLRSAEADFGFLGFFFIFLFIFRTEEEEEEEEERR